jgi:hypothetical protein
MKQWTGSRDRVNPREREESGENVSSMKPDQILEAGGAPKRSI